MLEDNFEKAAAVLRVVDGASEEGFRETLNGGERGLKFVRDVRDKIAADALKLAQVGDVVEHDNGAGGFGGAHGGDSGREKMLTESAGDDFGFDARFAGEHLANCFDQLGLTHHFDESAARLRRDVETENFSKSGIREEE